MEYSYEALDQNGKPISGKVTAATADAAIESLQRRGHLPALPGERFAHIAQIQPQGGEHLIISGAPQMDAPAERAEPLGQSALQRRLTILVGELHVPLATRVRGGQRQQRVAQLRQVRLTEQSLRCEHLGVRDRGAHVTATVTC